MPVPESQPAKFEWPPRALSEGEDAASSLRAAEIARAEARRPATRPDEPPVGATSWWSSVERTFFGVTHGTWRQRAAAAAWHPDGEDDYCGRCGQTVGMFERTPDSGVCPHCAKFSVPWNRVVRMGAYTGVLRDCVLEVKFTAWRRLAMDLGAQHGLLVRAALERHGVDPAGAIVVPIATSPWRRLSRGIDHSLAIARSMSRAGGMRLAPLLRRKHRPPQTGRTLDQRRRNVARTMYVSDGGGAGVLAGRTVLLVDDVMTSGATMREACRAMVEWSRSIPADGGPPRSWSIWACPVAVTNAVEEDGQAGHLSA